MEAWHIWLMIAIVLIIAEMFTADFLLALLGVAALVSAAASVFDLEIEAQLGVFALSSVFLLATVRPVVKKWIYDRIQAGPTNVEALVGRKVVVVNSVGAIESPGRVKLGSEEWRAYADNNESLAEGDVAEVLRVEGATLVIRRKVSDPVKNTQPDKQNA